MEGLVQVGKRAATPHGWQEGSQWTAIFDLVNRESSWNPNAQNPKSTAYGLFQFLNSTWATVGATKTSDPYGQFVAGLKYVKQRYGAPSSALAFHKKNGWYDDGGWLPPGQSLAVNATSRREKIMPEREYRDLRRGSREEDITAIVKAIMDELGDGRGGGGGVHIDNVMLPQGATVRELANEVDFRARVTSKGRHR
jgi:hypothetical protein